MTVCQPGATWKRMFVRKRRINDLKIDPTSRVWLDMSIKVSDLPPAFDLATGLLSHWSVKSDSFIKFESMVGGVDMVAVMEGANERVDIYLLKWVVWWTWCLGQPSEIEKHSSS